jgi:epoxyqueuosine reductase
VLIAAGNSGDRQFIAQCHLLADDASPIVRGMAVWALRQLMDDGAFAAFARGRAADNDPEVRREWQMAGVD